MEQTSFHQENFRRRTRYTAVFLILAAVFCVVTVLNINTGNVHIPVPKILRILFLKEGAATEYNIIWKIRLPRILMAALLGGALSLSGFLLQTGRDECQALSHLSFSEFLPERKWSWHLQ